MAITIELLFRNDVKNFVPVDWSVIFHSNTPFKLICRLEVRPVCIAIGFYFASVLS